MLRLLSAVLALLCLPLAPPVAAQSLAPRSFAGADAGEGARYSASQLDQLFPENGAFLRELGALAAERRLYGSDTTVTVVQFRDPTGAYGAFELFREPGMAPSDLTELSAASDRQAIFALSNMFVRVERASASPSRSDLELLISHARSIAEKDAGPFPAFGQYLPQGSLQGTRRFALGPAGLEKILPTGKGDWVGFELGAEVEAARYRVRGREATLLLVAYPTPQVAMAREKALSRWFNVNGAEEVVAGRPVVYTRRMTSLLAILAGAEAQKDGEELLAKVNYKTDLTWNEPAHKATDPPWGETLYKVFLGTFYFVGIGLAIGVIFAGIRLGIKRLFPGKVFDRPNSVEILQLGLGSKPIEGKDFYQ